MNQNKIVEAGFRQDALFPQTTAMEAHINTRYPFSSNKDYGSLFKH